MSSYVYYYLTYLLLQAKNMTLHITFLELPIYRHGFHSHTLYPQPEKLKTTVNYRAKTQEYSMSKQTQLIS